MANEKKSSTAGNPIQCKAAVCRKAGEPLVIEEVIVAPPSPYEVRIKILCTSLCYSDVNFWKMKEFPGIVPRILGHEAVGIVESVGEGVTEVTEGDLVVPVFISECGDCYDCLSKRSNLCSKVPFHLNPWMPRYEKSCRFTDLNGEVLYHFLFVSSFSEYNVVDVSHVVKIDPSVPLNRASLLGCVISTGFGAAWKSAQVEPGSTVAIFGLGMIGLAVADGARICGASRIIGIDVNPAKSEIGKKFGVTDFVNPKEIGDKPLNEVIKEMTNGIGADYCFECVGLASLVQEAYESSSKSCGKTVVLGSDKPQSQLIFNSNDLLHSGKTVMGSLFGGLKPKSDFPVIIKHIADKELDLDKYVTDELDFADINKAFDLLLSGKALRCVMRMPNVDEEMKRLSHDFKVSCRVEEDTSKIESPAMETSCRVEEEDKSKIESPAMATSLST